MATVITNVTKLQAMKDDLAGDYILDRNIDALATAGWNAGKGWEPIGTDGSPFTGTFSMAGYTISNLFMAQTLEFVGLFGVTSGATLSGPGTLKNVDITGIFNDGCTGALAGKTINTAITNIDSNGSIEGNGQRIGGLVGYLRLGTMADCHSSCVVLATATAASGAQAFVGGLIGVAEGTIPTRCHATGAVTGYGEICAGGLIGVLDVVTATDVPCTLSESYATGNVFGYDLGVYTGGSLGGLIGWMGEFGKSGCTINDAYARGNVSVQTPASAETGGLIGRIASADDLVEDSYSTGSVPGSGDAGGLIGYRRAGSTITACFWDTETSGTSDGVGNGAETGATGAITYLMKLQSTFTNAAWNFVTIWLINGVRNDGYPFHRAILPDALLDSPRTTSEEPVQDKITLELIRNVEMAARGRFFTDEEGNAVYKSRYARNP